MKRYPLRQYLTSNIPHFHLSSYYISLKSPETTTTQATWCIMHICSSHSNLMMIQSQMWNTTPPLGQWNSYKIISSERGKLMSCTWVPLRLKLAIVILIITEVPQFSNYQEWRGIRFPSISLGYSLCVQTTILHWLMYQTPITPTPNSPPPHPHTHPTECWELINKKLR